MTFSPRRRSFAALTLALALATAVGCGGGGSSDDAGKLTIKGKLLDGGKPLVIDPSKLKLPPGATALPPGTAGGSNLQVDFIPVAGGISIPATTNSDTGTFEVKGIKPGKYRVAVQAMLTMGAPDQFGGKHNHSNTKIEREVKEGEEVVIDVAKP